MEELDELARRNFRGSCYDDYVAWLREDGNYLGYNELVVAADFWSRCIVIVQKRDGQWQYLNFSGKESDPPLFLKYHPSSHLMEHYEWLKPRILHKVNKEYHEWLKAV